jgi:hypothetical protein
MNGCAVRGGLCGAISGGGLKTQISQQAPKCGVRLASSTETIMSAGRRKPEKPSWRCENQYTYIRVLKRP